MTPIVTDGDDVTAPSELAASTKADEIATALEEAIAAGKLPAGTVLRQDQLSAEFNVSRTPVREALRKVAALGLVTFTPNRGVRVVALDAEQWREAYLVRAELDGLAAELAATRISAERLAALQAANSDFRRVTEQLDRPLADAERQSLNFAWLAINNRFHDEILHAAGSQLLTRMTRSIRKVVTGQRLWAPGSELARLHAQSAEEHAAISQALAARSPAGAKALAREHVEHAWTIVELTLSESGQSAAAAE
ncbi:MAG: hypothetical protein V7607_2624 [Solirubrobacteraceae bacterium]